MTWKLTRGLKAKAVYQDPDTGRWISRIYGKNDPQGIATILIREREENRQIIEVGRQTEIKLDRLQDVVDEMIQQHLVCNGLIYRHNRWQFVANLKHPLTPDERNLIRRTKDKIRFDKHHDQSPAEIPLFERGGAKLPNGELDPQKVSQSKRTGRVAEDQDENRHEFSKTENTDSNFDEPMFSSLRTLHSALCTQRK